MGKNTNRPPLTSVHMLMGTHILTHTLSHTHTLTRVGVAYAVRVSELGYLGLISDSLLAE